ncbi:hypothetical protein ACFX15_025460 [Malus domestica]
MLHTRDSLKSHESVLLTLGNLAVKDETSVSPTSQQSDDPKPSSQQFSYAAAPTNQSRLSSPPITGVSEGMKSTSIQRIPSTNPQPGRPSPPPLDPSSAPLRLEPPWPRGLSTSPEFHVPSSVLHLHFHQPRSPYFHSIY